MLPQPLQQVRPPDRLSVRLVRYHARRTHRPDHAQRERQKTRDGGSDQLQQSSEDHSSVSSPKSLRTCLNAEATIDRLSMFLSIRFVRSSARLASSGSTSPGRTSRFRWYCPFTAAAICFASCSLECLLCALCLYCSQ